MPWSSSNAGNREAVKTKILAMMLAKLSDFNAALTGMSPAFSMSYGGVPITAAASSQFYRGDFESIPDPLTNWIWVTVDSGGKEDQTDLEFRRRASAGVYDRWFYTKIHFYLNPTIFSPAVNDPTGAQDQTTQRDLLRDRFTDWMIDDVFNPAVAQVQTLSSTIFQSGGDVFQECMITRVSAGPFFKGINNNIEVAGAKFIHRGVIYGAS